MSTSNKTATGRWPVLLASALWLPLLAVSGVAAVSGSAAHRGAYTLRCWQEGRLILEEQHVRLPPGHDIASSKLHVMDRNNLPMYLTETRNATCIVRARAPERARSVLP
jgi:hypothetical protein